MLQRRTVDFRGEVLHDWEAVPNSQIDTLAHLSCIVTVLVDIKVAHMLTLGYVDGSSAEFRLVPT